MRSFTLLLASDMLPKTLTKTIVEAIAPAAKDLFVWDTQMAGFGVRVSPAGRRSYVYQYRTRDGNQQRREVLGVHCPMTVQQARERARDLYAKVRAGEDPCQARRAAAATPAPAPVQTVNGVLDDFVRRHASGLRSAKEYERAFTRYVRPAIGDVPIGDLRRRHVVELLDNIKQANGPVMADRTLAYLRKALNWLAIGDDTFVSPIVKGMARTKPKERARDRILSDDELRALWQATEGAGFGALCRLILLSAQRPGEVAGLPLSSSTPAASRYGSM